MKLFRFWFRIRGDFEPLSAESKIFRQTVESYNFPEYLRGILNFPSIITSSQVGEEQFGHPTFFVF